MKLNTIDISSSSNRTYNETDKSKQPQPVRSNKDELTESEVLQQFQ